MDGMISLTSPVSFHRIPDEGMTMKGGIYTKEKCPICKGRFIDIGNELTCPAHQTRPRRVYVQIYSRLLHKPINICSDSRNIPFSSYEQARRILTVLRAEIDKSGDFDPTRYVAQSLKPLRFSNWSKAWIEKKEVEVQKNLRAPAYLKSLRVYLYKFQFFFRDIDIRDITTKMVNDFYLSLSGSPKYIKNILDALKKMLADAFAWGDIQQISKFPKIDIPDPDIRTIDLDQQDTVINAIQDRMDRAYILFTAREMVRPSETRALFWEDLDFRHDRVTIRRHFSLNQLRPTTKARQIKVLPLDTEVRESLLALPRHITSPFVFQKKGRPFSESWARKLWGRITKQMGINISLYQGTRHSSATEAADRVGVDATQQFLHHTNRRITERYVQGNPERLRKVLRKPG